MVIIGIVILLFLAFVYIGLPLWAKLLVFLINSFIPDPIPVVDEVLMIVAIINNILRVFKAISIMEWIRMHKALSICIGLTIIALIIIAIVCLF